MKRTNKKLVVGRIVNCVIKTRGSEPIFKYVKGNLVPNLVGYVIVPIEDFSSKQLRKLVKLKLKSKDNDL